MMISFNNRKKWPNNIKVGTSKNKR